MSNETMLAEAKAALHELVTGTSVVEVKHRDLEVTYTRADQRKLETYIHQLQGEIDYAANSSAPKRGRPFSFQ